MVEYGSAPRRLQGKNLLAMPPLFAWIPCGVSREVGHLNKIMLITRRKLPDQDGQIKPFQAIRFRQQSNAIIGI